MNRVYIGNKLVGISTVNSYVTKPDEEWQPQADWPNIRNLLKNDSETAYSGKTYILHYSKAYPTVTYNAPKWITSDGGVYYGNAVHTWTTNDEYTWVALYTNAEWFEFTNKLEESWYNSAVRKLWLVSNWKIKATTFTQCRLLQSIEVDEIKITTSSTTFQENCSLIQILAKKIDFSGILTAGHFDRCYQLRKIPDIIDISGCKSAQQLFNNCNNLTKVPDVLDVSQCTSCKEMFNNCYALTKVPDVLDVSNCTTCQDMFKNCYSLTKVPDVLDVSNSTNCAGMFQYCSALTKVPDVLDVSNCTTCASMFCMCYALTKVPDVLDVSNSTTSYYLFQHCYNLKKLPDVIDLSNSTNNNNIFGGCYVVTKLPDRVDLRSATSANNSQFLGSTMSLRELPYVTANYTLDFTRVGSLISKSSVATFDSNGEINGGFIYRLDSYANGSYQYACPNAGQQIKFGSYIKNLFTTDERTKIVALLNAKNWTVSW